MFAIEREIKGTCHYHPPGLIQPLFPGGIYVRGGWLIIHNTRCDPETPLLQLNAIQQLTHLNGMLSYHQICFCQIFWSLGFIREGACPAWQGISLTLNKIPGTPGFRSKGWVARSWLHTRRSLESNPGLHAGNNFIRSFHWSSLWASVFFSWGLPQNQKPWLPVCWGHPTGQVSCGPLFFLRMASMWWQPPPMAPLVAWHHSLFTVLHQLSLLMDSPDVAKWMLLMMGWDSWNILKQPFEGVAGWSLFLVISFALQDVKFPLFALGVGTIEQWSTYGPSRVSNDCPGFLGWVKVCVYL